MLKKFLKWEFLAFSSSFCMGCRFKPFLNAFVWLIRMLYHRTKGEATDQDMLESDWSPHPPQASWEM